MGNVKTLTQGSFTERFCRQHSCTTQECVLRVLWQSLPGWFVPFAKLIHRFNSDYFANDIHLINRVGTTSVFAECQQAVQDFCYELHHNRRMGSRGLKISRRRLFKVYRDMEMGAG